MKILTSIAPKRLDIQQEAISSWLDLGFDVISFNDPSEAIILEGQFPFVDFQKIELSKEQFPFVPIKYMIKWGLQHDTHWLLNSDIILDSDKQEIDKLHESSKKGLVFGHRIDIQAEERNIYAEGFDFFIINNHFSKLFRFNNTSLQFGLPWWDFWLPFLFIRHNTPIFNWGLKAYHKIHSTNWNMDDFYKNALVVSKECGINVNIDRNDAHILAHYIYSKIKEKTICLSLI